MKFDIDLNNTKVTNAIAGLINSAFETGLNPAWFQVDSLNGDGFLDAAFADSGLETPSGNQARNNWSIKAQLWDEDNDEPVFDTGFVTVTPQLAVERWTEFANNSKNIMSHRACSFLVYLEYLSKGVPEKYCEHVLLNHYEPDGVHDDAMVQYILAQDVIFG